MSSHASSKPHSQWVFRGMIFRWWNHRANGWLLLLNWPRPQWTSMYCISTFLQFSRKNLFPQSRKKEQKVFQDSNMRIANRFFLDLKLLGCNGVTMEWMSFLSSEARKHPQLICKNFAIFRVSPRPKICNNQGSVMHQAAAPTKHRTYLDPESWYCSGWWF